MYFLSIWDTNLAASTGDGALNSIAIPVDLAKMIFSLNHNKFPLLSGLSFDDYDLFSEDQLIDLDNELKILSSENRQFSSILQDMRLVIAEAHSSNKGVLFDPFRKL